MSAPPPPGYYVTTPAPPRPSRPIGVAILAILIVLVGVLLLVGAILLLLFSGALFFGGLEVFGLATTVVGGVVFILGLIWVAVGLGLWNLRPWAWWLAVIVMVLSIIASFASPAFAIIPVLILVYLILVRGRFR